MSEYFKAGVTGDSHLKTVFLDGRPLRLCVEAMAFPAPGIGWAKCWRENGRTGELVRDFADQPVTEMFTGHVEIRRVE